ncbi:MAG: LamG-like jellyroll fold domain-containing protein, partial [Bacteroidota bacterium]
IYTKSVTGVDEFFNTNIFIRDGQWHHVAVSRKGNNYDVYIDGNLTNTFEKSIDLYNNFSIGNWNGTSIQNSQWIGDLDEIRLWDVVRSQSDIQATMNCELTGNETCLAGYWNFNQGTPAGDNTGLTTLIDLTPNGNDGTLFDFTLADNTSNWVTSGADISGGCSNVMCSVLSVENIDFKDKIENFKVYPNPSHGSVNLEIVNPMQESVLVQIYDSDGRQVYYNIIKDHQILTIEEQVFERNGIYLITVNRGSKVNHKKLVISGLR